MMGREEEMNEVQWWHLEMLILETWLSYYMQKKDVDKLPPGKLSTKGVGGTAPNLSDAKTLDDGAVVPLGKPEEQQGSKVEQTKYDSVHSKNTLTLHMSTHMTANNLYDIVSPCALFIIYC
ncbi:hypothetical protein Peur_035799 [Populus x canadensis]